MKTEFKLDEKISWESLPPRNEEIIDHGVISTINVKEFIRLLKDKYMKYKDSFRILEHYYRIFDDIDKLAGDKLI